MRELGCGRIAKPVSFFISFFVTVRMLLISKQKAEIELTVGLLRPRQGRQAVIVK